MIGPPSKSEITLIEEAARASAVVLSRPVSTLALPAAGARPTLGGSFMPAFAGGSGGFYKRYGVREVRGSHGQESDVTCGIACIREMVRVSAGRNVSEAELLSQLGYKQLPTHGLYAEELAELAQRYFPGPTWKGGSAHELYDLIGRGPYVAPGAGLPVLLGRTRDVGHWVLLRSASATRVRIWDPWGLTAPQPGPGVSTWLPKSNFRTLWDTGKFGIVAPASNSIP